MTPTERRLLRNGLLFCSPWLLGVSLFMLYPLGAALYYSFTDYSVLLPPVFIGLGNYADLVVDPLFWKSLYNTLFFATGAVGFGVLVSMFLALLLNNAVRGISVYRTLFFIPSLMPIVASSILWMWMYNGENGIINTLFGYAGIQGPAWLTDATWTKPALILMAVWGAGHTMVVFLAGLQDIPRFLYEAAVIDGAGYFRRLVDVTIPMLSPVIYFNVLMSTIGSLQVFTQAFIMTDSTGSPEGSALFYVLQLYNVGFQDLRMGYACAMAWALFLLIFLLTLLMTRAAQRYITYDR